MTDLHELVAEARRASETAERAQAAAEKALAATQAQADGWVFIRTLMQLLGDPVACKKRLADLEKAHAELSATQIALDAARQAHAEATAGERADLDRQLADLSERELKLRVERAAWDEGHWRRVAAAERDAQLSNDPNLPATGPVRPNWREGLRDDERRFAR